MTQQDLEQIDLLLQKRLQGFATKDDLKNFATKDDIKNFATKDDIKRLEDKLESKIEIVKKELGEKIDNGEARMFELLNKHKADKEDVNQLNKRVEKIEDHLNFA